MIHLTESASSQVKKIMEDEGKTTFGLRVGVEGGGCSGMQYSLTFEKEPTSRDQIFEENGIRVFVDEEALLYLRGLKVDYTREMVGGGFKFINPNASRSCGCGTSFSV